MINSFYTTYYKINNINFVVQGNPFVIYSENERFQYNILYYYAVCTITMIFIYMVIFYRVHERETQRMLNKQSGLRSIDSFNELDGKHVENVAMGFYY